MRAVLFPAGLVVASLLALPAAVQAGQYVAAASSVSSSSAAQTPTPNRSADFLFGRPHGSIGVRGNWVFASAGSDIFDFVTRHLTLDKKDFNSPGFAADLSIAIGRRLDVQGGFEMTRVSHSSEYRDYVDNLLQPIQQTTSLSTNHFVGSLRYSLTPKGQDISRLAWIPSRVVPFVGVGGGIVHYEFHQTGDFVDFQDLDVFPDSFLSSGWTPTLLAFGGVDMKLHKVLYATVQGRYTHAAGDLSSDFIDFDPIDLSGFRISAGINVLF
jgi:hypothetical protein